MKSVMGELTDSSNRAEGFSLMPVVWGFGATIGYVKNFLAQASLNNRFFSPLIGGSLSRPHERFPKYFSGAFWKEYPYFLPCLVASGYVLCAFVVTLFLFKEVCSLHLEKSEAHTYIYRPCPGANQKPKDEKLKAQKMTRMRTRYPCVISLYTLSSCRSPIMSFWHS